MMPYFTLFGRHIPLYGLLFYIGLIMSCVVALLICKHKSLPKFEIAYSGVYTMIGAMLGAKLLFIAVSLRQIIAERIPVEAIIKGGFVFYGGVFGGLLGLLIYTKQFRMSISPFLEVYAAVLPLGHSFGRVGCFFAGCCYGIPYSGPFSHTYRVSLGSTPTNIPLLPIQLIEAGLLLTIFFLLLTVYFRNREANSITLTVYLITYPFVRFITEFFRGDRERGIFCHLSVSQWISLFAFITGTVFFAIYKTRTVKTEHIKRAE